MTLIANHIIDDSLSLTEIRVSDKLSIVEYINDEEINMNTLHIPFPYYERDAEEFLTIVRKFEEDQKHVGQYAIRLKGEMVGGIGFLYSHGDSSHKAEVGYWIGKRHRGRGLMTLAIQKMIEIAFSEKGLFRLEAHVFPENIASMRALEKAGFQKEGFLKSTFIKEDRLVDTFLFAIIRKE